jgi:hypothetical protein
LPYPQKKKWRQLLLLSAAVVLNSSTAFADSTEIQIYRDDLTDKGESNFDFASNFSKTSSHSELQGRSVFQAVGEYSYGFAHQWEAGVKIPLFHVDGNWYGNGLIGELKYVAPHDDQGFYWGAEIEAGYTSPFHEKRQWALEVVPILGYRADRWQFIANPGLSITSAGDERGVVTFEPGGKISYELMEKSAVALEYFVDAGSLNSILPRNKRSEMAFLALDTTIGKSVVNIGLGHGLTTVSPRWVAKFVIDIEFD